MTIIGVSGCTGLIISGFGLKDCITGMVSTQYGDILTYELEISLDESANKDDVYKIGCELHVDLSTTFSCNYAIDGKECGKCGNCLWRKKHTYPSYGRKV